MLIATAGHVDHGKTSLVRALTGVDTDRLLEEKKRGLTIELGFAYKAVSEDKTLGFIDVPGHHRFMNTMISGVTGIDLGLLIVAADDGPMPQTLEHLQILQLLGVTDFLGVITKTDLVDYARLDAVTQQLGALLPGAQICKVSTKTSAGITELSNTILGKAEKKTQGKPQASGIFRLYIDRVFTKKGSGLVVTGTALSGRINIGDTLYLHSAFGAFDKKTPVKVRALHAQGRPVETGYAGQRCAINITGKLSTQDVRRGDIVCAKESLMPSLRLDCRFRSAHSEARALKHMGRVKLYIGSRKVSARAYFLSKSDTSGQWLQFILDKSAIAFHGDPFLVKDDSEHHILGGGVVIDPDPKKPGKNRTAHLSHLAALEPNNPALALSHLIFKTGAIVNLNAQKRIWNLTDIELENILESSPFKSENFVIRPRKTGDLILSAALWNDCENCLLRILLDWHNADLKNRTIAIDMLQGLTREDIGEEISEAIFSDILSGLIGSGKITQTENKVRLFGFKQKLILRPNGDWLRLENLMRGRLPLRSEIEKELGFEPLKIEALTRSKLKSGDLFNIGEKRIGHPETLYAMAVQVLELSTHGPFTVIDAKNVFGLGRGQTIEVLEFFDTIGLTIRNANTRTATHLDVARRVFKR